MNPYALAYYFLERHEWTDNVVSYICELYIHFYCIFTFVWTLMGRVHHILCYMGLKQDAHSWQKNRFSILEWVSCGRVCCRDSNTANGLHNMFKHVLCFNKVDMVSRLFMNVELPGVTNKWIISDINICCFLSVRNRLPLTACHTNFILWYHCVNHSLHSRRVCKTEPCVRLCYSYCGCANYMLRPKYRMI